MSLLPDDPTLPVLVFLAELGVVTIGTMRIIFVARGMKVLAPLLGFFEVSTWLFAIGQVMQHLGDLSCCLAYAAGFTIGNFLGVLLEKRLGIGTVVVRTITNKEPGELIARLKAADYGVTSIDAQGATGPVKIIFTVIKRKQLPQVVALVEDFDPNAFYSVEEIQTAASGVFPAARGRSWLFALNQLRIFRSAA